MAVTKLQSDASAIPVPICETSVCGGAAEFTAISDAEPMTVCRQCGSRLQALGVMFGFDVTIAELGPPSLQIVK